MATTTEIDRTRALRDFGDVFVALDRLPLPVFAVASNGVVRSLNMAAEEIVGDKRGVQYSQLVAPPGTTSALSCGASACTPGSRP
jgi:hypothetical protein